MSIIEVVAISVIAGIAGAIAAEWRLWRDLAVDYRRHGRANNLCDDPSCPTCAR